jgi:hypothetical protein
MAVAFIPLLLVVILFLIVPVVGLIVLQVYLSKMEKDWPGLILPILSIVWAIISTLILLGFAVRGAVIITVIVYILLAFTPSIIFFLIYKNVHKKQSPNKELDKMTIQDLS